MLRLMLETFLIKEIIISKHMKIFLKIAIGQGDDYTTGCLLDYPDFKENYKMLVIDRSKQQAPDADPRAIQQINFNANLERAGNTTMFFSKRDYFGLFTRNCESMVNML